jgi:HIRAN domain-containing protein
LQQLFVIINPLSTIFGGLINGRIIMMNFTVKEIADNFDISKATAAKKLAECQEHIETRTFHTNYYSYEKECKAYDFKDIITHVFKQKEHNEFFKKYLNDYITEQTAGLQLSEELKIAGTHVIETSIQPGTHVYLIPEPDNEYDSKALKTFNAINNEHIGYIYQEDQDLIYNSRKFQNQKKLFGVITDTDCYEFHSYETDEWVSGQKKYAKWFL